MKESASSSNSLFASKEQSKPDSAVQHEAQHAKESFFSGAAESPSFFQAKPAFQASTRPAIQRQCAHCEAEEKQGKEEERIDKKPELQKMPAFDSDADAGDDNVQTKLKIGRPGDRYEQEADAMAEKVAGSAPAVSAGVQAKRNGHSAGNDAPDISAQFKLPEVKEMEPVPPGNKEQAEENAKNLEKTAESKEEGKTKGDAAKEKKKPAVEMPERKKPEGEEEAPDLSAKFSRETANSDTPSIQKTNKAGGNASPNLQTSLKGTKGGGQGLEPGVQSEMEGHFSRDLSGVRIHTGHTAVQMNRDLDARAFTNEQDIYFNSGEYDPAAPEGKKLLAHELTHTVQQGSEGGAIQRWAAAPQTVTTDGKAEKPNDGAEVEGKVNSKIDNDERVKDQDDLDDDEKEKAKKPDRGEVRSEKAVVKGSGISAPPVDRGAVAQDKIEGEKAEMNAQLAKNTPEGKQGGGEGAGKSPELSAADAAAQKAQAAQQKARAVVIPEKPEPFKHPRIEQPKDSEGKALPVNDKIDTQVRGLGMIGEALRDYGYESKRHAAEQEIQAHAIQAVNEKLREDLANAKEGTNTIEAHTEERKQLSQLSKEAHQESTERQQFVAEKGPDMANKAKEGSADSGALAGDAKGKAEQSQSETPEDEDAQADAEAQNGQMNEVADGSVSMDKAIQQSEERANQYTADAAEAAEKNQQADAQVKETDEVIAKTDARIAELHGKNAVTEAKTNEVAPGPDLIRKFSKEQARSGEDIIAVSILLEQEINAVQEQYLADMAAIESSEAAEKRILEALEKGSGEQKLSPEEQLLLELSGLNDVELQQRLSEIDPAQRDLLIKKLEELQAQPEPEQAAQPKSEGKEEPGDPRAEQIQGAENRRIEGLKGPLDVADNHMSIIPADQQARIAHALVVASYNDKVKNINVVQMGKEMLKGMINPLSALGGIKDGWAK